MMGVLLPLLCGIFQIVLSLYPTCMDVVYLGVTRMTFPASQHPLHPWEGLCIGVGTGHGSG